MWGKEGSGLLPGQKEGVFNALLVSPHQEFSHHGRLRFCFVRSFVVVIQVVRHHYFVNRFASKSVRHQSVDIGPV